VCLGLGLAIFAATPVVVLLLFATVLASLLGVILLLSYIPLLIIGGLTGALIAAQGGLRLFGKARFSGRTPVVLALGTAVATLALVQFVPVIGGLVTFVTLWFGLGSLTLFGYRARTAT
jgi:hypothetical protein